MQWSRVDAPAARRIGTAQRGRQLVTQMRGRAAAIGLSVNRRRNWRLQEVGGQLRGKQYGDGGSAQSDQSAGHWQCTQPPSAPSPRSCTASPTIGSIAPARPVGRQQIRTLQTSPSATSWLRGHDSAPHWGSCGKPPVRYTFETAEQCLAATVALLGSDDFCPSQIAQRC